jgi:O-antigen ligase
MPGVSMREIILWLLIAVSIPYVWRRPFVGLVIYLAANVIRPEMFFWGGTAGGRVFMVFYGLILFASFFSGSFSRIGEVKQKEFLLMIWMMFAVFLSIFFAQYQIEIAYYYAFELLKAFGICALIYILIKDFADIKRLQTVLLGCFTFLGIWGIEQQFRGNERLEGLGGSSWGDSNGVAAMFVLFLPVALARGFCSNIRRDRLISIGMATIIVALIICTKSRGGFLGLLVCLFSFGFYSRKIGKILKISLVLALLAAPFATDAYLERMKTMQTTDTENVEGSARSRLILWQAGLMVFADNPIFGTGFLSYPEAKMKYENNFMYLEDEFREWVFRKESKKVTHNTYIQMLSDCGLIGGLPFILLVIGGIKAGFKARNRLLGSPEDDRLYWLCGLSAGVTGYAVCILTIDSITSILLFVQLVAIGMVSRMVFASADKLSPNGNFNKVNGCRS